MTGERRVVASVALSLDGRTTGPSGDHDLGWMAPHVDTAAARAHVLRATEPATTVLFGRKMYDGLSGFWPTVVDEPCYDPLDRAFSRWLNDAEKIVFSTTLTASPWQNTRVTATDPGAVVKDLRARPGGDIVVLGSASIIRALADAGELDRLSITLCPELLGGGASLFRDSLAVTSWTLADSTPTETGAICLLYDRVSALA